MFLVAYWMPAALLGTRSAKMKNDTDLAVKTSKVQCYLCMRCIQLLELRNRHCKSVSYKTPLVGVNKKSVVKWDFMFKAAWSIRVSIHGDSEKTQLAEK